VPDQEKDGLWAQMNRRSDYERVVVCACGEELQVMFI
jgi:hypothetical protein